MNERSWLVKLDKFIHFTPLHDVNNLHCNRLKTFYNQEVNKGTQSYKVKKRTHCNEQRLNELWLDNTCYTIQHNTPVEVKESENNNDAKTRRQRYKKTSGSSAIVKDLYSEKTGKIELKIKIFNGEKQLSNKQERSYNDRLLSIPEKFNNLMCSVNIHKILDRKNTAAYMRKSKSGEFKFYLVMQNLGQDDLRQSNLNNTRFYQSDNTLIARIKLAIQILEQVQQLFDNGYCWLDAKPDNIIITYQKGQPDKAFITDFDGVADEKAIEKPLHLHYTYMPSDIISKDYNNNTPVKIEGIFDRKYVISVLSYCITCLFPDFLIQHTKKSEHTHCNILYQPMLQPSSKNQLAVKENIYRIVLDMYNSKKNENSQQKENSQQNECDVDLNNYIDRLKQIRPMSISYLTGLLPGIATFITFSTLINSKHAFGLVIVGCLFGLTNTIVLYQNEKYPTSWTRLILIGLECLGICCLSYDAIVAFHPKVSATLPAPFNGANDQLKLDVGIGLVIFAVILMFFYYFLGDTEQQIDQSQSTLRHARQRWQKILTFSMVLIGTYPLMIGFLSDLNHKKAPLWLCFIALLLTLGSAFFQTCLISRYEENLIKKNQKLLWFEYFGKAFMALEVILSFANTAFSSNHSSFEDIIDMIHDNRLSKNSQHIGLGLFIFSLIIFAYVTKRHFNVKLFNHSCNNEADVAVENDIAHHSHSTCK